ncbi:MAG TPA: hypothetical protein VFB79_10660, partial [Candidatus Angelobacter sp.]|nr:hypothetical protein [Candidatus Angelobacter sp.]
LQGDNLSTLIKLRDASTVEADRNRLSVVLAYAYAAQERWAELLPVAEALTQSSPDSLIAFNFAVQAYTGLKHLGDWQKLVDSRLEKYPDEVEYKRSKAQLAQYQGDVSTLQKVIKPLIDSGKASDQDLNLYAWSALLLPGPISPDAVEAAERANTNTKSSNFPILHTLACLYAYTGKTTQARELLLKAMDAAALEEPNSEIWFGLGELAEQYGELATAQTLYSRIEKPKVDVSGTSYMLAQQRLVALKSVITAKGSGN